MQLAAVVLGSMAGHGNMLQEPVLAVGQPTRGRQTRGGGSGHKTAAALSTDPYAFQESVPRRSGSADVASIASDSSADVGVGKRGERQARGHS